MPAPPLAISRGIPAAVVELLLDLGAQEPELTLDTTLTDLAFTEMDLAELAMGFEEQFRIGPFTDRVLDRWPTATLGQLIEMLRVMGAKV